MRSCSSVFWEKSGPVVIFVPSRTQSDIGPRGKEITAQANLANNDKLLIFEAIIKLSHSASDWADKSLISVYWHIGSCATRLVAKQGFCSFYF